MIAAAGAVVGGYLRLNGESAHRKIVGVVPDIRVYGLYAEAGPQIYVPYSEPYRNLLLPLQLNIVVREREHLTSASENTLRTALMSEDPEMAVEVKPLNEVISGSLDAERFRAFVLGAFSALALALSIAAVYSTVAFAASMRTKEMGVRLALGGSASQIIWLCFREGLVLIVLGLPVGALAAFAGRSVITGLFYQSDVYLPEVAAAFALLAVSLAAGCLAPAIRLKGLDPASVLRHE